MYFLSLVGNAALLGGVFFPVAFLPGFLRPLALLFPFTYGVDALRALWLGTESLFPLPYEFATFGARPCLLRFGLVGPGPVRAPGPPPRPGGVLRG